MENYLLLLAFPLIWPWIAKRIWYYDITWLEMGLNIVIVVAVVSTVWFLGKGYQTHDVEIWNGKVTGKAQESVPCSHSYQCHCKSTKNGTSCDTCYEHPNDWDWDVDTTVGKFTIDRIDSRGSDEPPRWTTVQPGQPVAVDKWFTNYVKAAPQSLFNPNSQALSKFGPMVPPYPDQIYDYQYDNRVLSIGTNVPNIAGWNYDLAMMLRDLGPAKQVNAIIMFVNSTDPSFEYAVQGKWLGAKKNDVVVLLGTPHYPEISWVRVISWTDNQLFKVQLRDDILATNTVDKTKILDMMSTEISKSFQRKHMRDFEYLKEDIMPPDWVIWLAIILSVGGSIALSVFFKYYNVISSRSGFYGN
jgi:hypothetical protein